ETAFYDYLRSGHARDHGSAAGPMAEVVSALSPLPDSDIRAMAVYLSRLNPTPAAETADVQTQSAIAASVEASQQAARISPKGARIFEAACGSCHEGNSILSPLTLNSNLHSDVPDNVLQVLMNGVEAPAILAETTGRDAPEVMSMPAFRDVLDKGQMQDLAAYLRARFAPGKGVWADAGQAIDRIKSMVH
ncbi:MAG: c-type cytochrome, partial [Pararhizobium sp.]